MDIADKIKHAPKWVWLSAAGLSVGVIGLRLYHNRTTADNTNTATPTVSTPAATPIGSQYYGTAGVSSSPVLVTAPSSDVGSSVTQSVFDPSPIIDSIGGLLTGVIGPVQTTLDDILLSQGQNISLLAGAGSAPQPIINVSPVVVAPAPIAPPAPAPTPVNNVVPITAAKCPSSHPLGSPPNCYRTVATKGKCSHNYLDGRIVPMGVCTPAMLGQIVGSAIG